MRYLIFFFVILGIGCQFQPIPASKTQFPQNQKTTLCNIDTSVFTPLHYRHYEPSGVCNMPLDSSRLYPLVVHLHGANQRQAVGGLPLIASGTGDSVISSGFLELNKVSVQFLRPHYGILPQVVGTNTWAGSHWSLGTYSGDNVPPTDEILFIYELVKCYIENHLVHPDSIYVTGESMGGGGVMALLANDCGDSTLFAAGVAMSFYGPDDFASLYHLSKQNLYLFHGDNDPSISFPDASALADTIEGFGASMGFPDRTYFEPMTGMGHNVWDSVWNKGWVIDTLFSKSK